MLLLTKTIHVLAVGLWFGSTVFFSLVATPVIFNTFGSLAAQPLDQRPAWLPASFDKDNGVQLGGLAVGPIFPWYFLLQGVCGLVAVATALPLWSSEPQQSVHKIRFYLLACALGTILLAWPIAQRVSTLRAERYTPDPAVAASAKADFGRWHVYSLLLNFVTMGLVTAAMGLAARLPPSVPVPASEPSPAEPAPVS